MPDGFSAWRVSGSLADLPGVPRIAFCQLVVNTCRLRSAMAHVRCQREPSAISVGGDFSPDVSAWTCTVIGQADVGHRTHVTEAVYGQTLVTCA